MPINEELIEMFIAYLWEEVRHHSIYVLGAQGELVVDILPRIPSMESVDRTKEVLERISKNFKSFKEFSVFTAKAFDCSGLGVNFFLKHKLIKSDCIADTLYTEYCTKIPKKDLRKGDMVFQQGTKKVTVYDEKLKKDVTKEITYMHHVGYYVDENKVIEAKGRLSGVVESTYSDSKWSHAGRPKFWEAPSPEKPVLTRELSLTDPMMKGDDVKTAQELLIKKGYNPGVADGVFGKNTEIASKNFKYDNGLKSDTGTIGKKTAEKLGFKWEG